MRLLGFAALIVVCWLVLRRLAGASSTSIGAANYQSGGDGNELTTPVPLDTPIDETSSTITNNPLQLMAEAIFNNESGNGNPGTLAVRNNNPGNLKSVSGGFQQFSDFGSGWDALQNYITQHTNAHPDWDFYDFFNWYLRGSTTAPSVDSQGNSDSYADQVAAYMGADPTQTVSSALQGD